MADTNNFKEEEMKGLQKALMLIGGVFVCSTLINATQQQTIENSIVLDAMEKKLVNDYNVYALPMPEKLNLAGEVVPVENPDIRERMDRELLVNTYWQSNGLLLFKRANKFFPIIEPILKKHGVPDDFKYLAVIESGTNASFVAGKSCRVLADLKSTGKEYGLEVNQNVDERYHIEKATEVACEYLKKSKARFGSWTLAAAAYNAGKWRYK